MKGFEYSVAVLVSVIMIIVSGVLILLWVSGASRLACDGQTETCRLAVQSAFFAAKAGIDVESNCKSSDIKFRNEEPEEVNRIVAQEIEKCVYKFHEGKLDLGQGTTLVEGIGTCYTCARLDFSDYSKKDKYNRESMGKGKLLDFLWNNKVVCSRPKKTFSDYIYDINKAYKAGKSFMYIRPLDPIINPSGKYFIAMYINKNPQIDRLLNVIVDLGPNTVRVALFNEEESSDFYKHCQVTYTGVR